MLTSAKQSLEGQKIVIIGAGLVGTLGAIMLAKRGASVEIVERQMFDPTADYSNQRSFNITVSARGEAALKAADVWDRIKAKTIPIKGRMCHTGTITTIFPYSKNGDVALYGARRSDVNAELLKAAMEIPSITIRFGWFLSDINKHKGTISISPVKDKSVVEEIIDADFFIGADGVGSTMRRLMHLSERADFALRYLDWNYREIFIPKSANPQNPWVMDRNSLHIWPRGDLMMFALPNPDGSFTGNFIYPISNEQDFECPEKMTALFQREFPDVAAMLPDVGNQLRGKAPSYFQTQKNSKWSLGDKFVLVGDAAHATVPFYGQGMNSGFESISELVHCVEKFGHNNRELAFLTFQNTRKPHTDAVADLSIKNFEELRSNFRRILPQARRTVDVLLHSILKDKYVPLHVKISHSLTAYQTAIDECARRDRILRYFGFDLLVWTAATWLFAQRQAAMLKKLVPLSSVGLRRQVQRPLQTKASNFGSQAEVMNSRTGLGETN